MIRLRLAITGSIVLALVLSILPMPDWASAWRPAWLLLVLCYWCLALPERCGLATAWLSGLVLDVLQSTLLGQSAFTMTLVAYVVTREHRRLRMFSLGHQALLLGASICGLPWLAAWLPGNAPRLQNGLPTALVSVFLWPWAFIVLRDLRRRCS
jgi:rod shape-determining protein MreD